MINLNYLKIASYVFSVLFGCYGMHKFDSIRYDQLINKQEALKNAQIEQANKDRDNAIDKYNQVDTQRNQELLNEQNTITSLHRKLDNKSIRLSIPSSCKTTTSTGVDHAETRTDLDSGTANGLVSITDRGDKAIIQLGACQDILKAERN